MARATPFCQAKLHVLCGNAETTNQRVDVSFFYSENKKLDDVYLQNYLNINVIPNIKRINGVGDANDGAKNYSMRIWLDPTKLAAYGLNPT